MLFREKPAAAMCVFPPLMMMQKYRSKLIMLPRIDLLPIENHAQMILDIGFMHP
jgi:hypothetical protein